MYVLKLNIQRFSILSLMCICIFSQRGDDPPALMAVGVVDGTSEAIFQTVMSLGSSRSE